MSTPLETMVARNRSSDDAWTRLQLALDGRAVRDAMAASGVAAMFGRGRLEQCRVDRVHFGSGLGFVIDYTLRYATAAGERTGRLFGQVPIENAEDAFASARRKCAALAHGEPHMALLHDLGLILRAPGVDERIVQLRAMLARPMASAAFSDPVIAATRPADWTAVLISHRLGKRAVLRLQATDRCAILKLYKRKSNAARLCAAITGAIRNQEFRSDSSFSVPPVFAVVEDGAGLLMEHIEGQSLHDLVGPQRLSGTRSAGAAAARLHACDIPDLQPYGLKDELRLLGGWLEFVASVRPSLRAGFAAAFERLAEAGRTCQDHIQLPIHRDFHDKQIIVAENRTALIDFDTVRLGDPAQDVGNYFAHIELRAATAHGRTDREEKVAFLDGYSSARPLPAAANIDWHRRATLLRLAFIAAFSDEHSHISQPLASRV